MLSKQYNSGHSTAQKIAESQHIGYRKKSNFHNSLKNHHFKPQIYENYLYICIILNENIT